MTRYLILAVLSVVTPVRRGLMHIEGHLARAEYKLRTGTGALFLAFAALMLGGCVPGGGPGAVVGAVFAALLAMFSLVVLFTSHVEIFGQASQRDRDFGKLVTAAALALACVTVYGCGPSLATAAAVDEVERLDAQCAGELDAMHFTAGDDDSAIRALLAGCAERAIAFCDAHHITHADTELCP